MAQTRLVVGPRPTAFSTGTEEFGTISVFCQSGSVLIEGDLEDRRRVLVFPAPRGVAKYEAIRAAVDSDQMELAERIGDEQLGELTRVLSQVADALQ